MDVRVTPPPNFHSTRPLMPQVWTNPLFSKAKSLLVRVPGPSGSMYPKKSPPGTGRAFSPILAPGDNELPSMALAPPSALPSMLRRVSFGGVLMTLTSSPPLATPIVDFA